jgi:predicted transglutaminase-like cysteine proteinase
MQRKAITAALGLLIGAAALSGGAEWASALPNQPAPIALTRLFDGEQPGETLDLLTKWTRVLAETGAGDAACPASAEPCRFWADVKSGLAGEADELALLGRVNDAFNQVPYRPDERVWSAVDYWATPAEFLGRGGDCEDFAIAKYFLLRELGVPAEAMRIAVVQDNARALMHAVLVVQTTRGRFVLDNLTAGIIPAGGAAQYVALFAVNQESIWVYIPITRSTPAGG